MKTMCPPIYHNNGFVTTQALGHMMEGWSWLTNFCFKNNIAFDIFPMSISYYSVPYWLL